MSKETPSADLYSKVYGPIYPQLGTDPIPVESYISPDHFEVERERIFKNSWLMVAHESELPEPGDYLVKRLPVLDTSVIIVRGRDGVVRGFHNVCRHRANELIYEEGTGHAKQFSCKFHAWCYNLDGSLRGITERDRFADLDTSQLGLVPVSVDSWKGFLFLHSRPNPDQTLMEYLGEIGQDLDPYPFDQLVVAAHWTADVAVNWKAFVDAFQEGYHVPYIHRNVAPSLFSGGKRPNCRLSGFRLYEKHRAMTTPKNPDFVPSPTEALAASMSNSLSQKSASNLSQQLWPGLNHGGDPDFGFDINVIFPTSFIDTSQGWCFTYEFWPVAVDRTHWVAKFYTTRPSTYRQRIGQELSIVQFREALLEDLNTLEATQRGMASGAIRSMYFSDQEIALRHQHAVVSKLVEA